MGNEAIALGALHAGICLAAGYPEHLRLRFWRPRPVGIFMRSGL